MNFDITIRFEPDDPAYKILGKLPKYGFNGHLVVNNHNLYDLDEGYNWGFEYNSSTHEINLNLYIENIHLMIWLMLLESIYSGNFFIEDATA